MRALLLPVLLLAAAGAACDRPRAPSPRQAGSALPSPSGSDAAQSASVASVAASAPADVPVTALDAGKPAAAAKAPRSDPRWRDVDPNELAVARDPALAAFEEAQRKRDAELMARDAAEADARPREYAPEYEDRAYAEAPAERYPPEDREPRSPYEDEDPYARQGRGPSPYEDGPYGGRPLPPEAGPWDEPAPYEDEMDPYDPGYEDEYDPRLEDDYRR